MFFQASPIMTSLRWPSGPSDVGTCRATQFLCNDHQNQWAMDIQWGYYNPTLKHLHEFMHIDGEIVNTHIYHVDSFHYPFTSWPIANFGGLSKKITSIPAEARWITSRNVKHVL
jgi:hypothetical protein